MLKKNDVTKDGKESLLKGIRARKLWENVKNIERRFSEKRAES
jgi:hypothetical protein